MLLAEIAGTPSPRRCFQRLLIGSQVRLLRLTNRLVRSERIQAAYSRGRRSVIRPQRRQSLAFCAHRLPLADRSSEYRAFERWVAVNLRHPDGDIGALSGVVVVSIIHEGLPEG